MSKPRIRTRTKGPKKGSKYPITPKRSINEPELSKGYHTGGVKKLPDGRVAKPLIGRQHVDGEWTYYPTREYEAIKELSDLPHIPKDVEKTDIDGVPHLIRNDLMIVEGDDFNALKREDLISIEKTIREANRRGWSPYDQLQIGYDTKHGEFVVYDWSNASKSDTEIGHRVNDTFLINRLWKQGGFENYIKAREWAEDERMQTSWSNVKRNEPYLRYAYLSMARPPWFGMDLPKGSIAKSVKKDQRWKPLGVIFTPTPLSNETIQSCDLTPTRYYMEGSQ